MELVSGESELSQDIAHSHVGVAGPYFPSGPLTPSTQAKELKQSNSKNFLFAAKSL